jgi:pyruvate/2-oxoglutarate dehydrogenase complex dihydrolipoamide acyltransferase (E2) component
MATRAAAPLLRTALLQCRGFRSSASALRAETGKAAETASKGTTAAAAEDAAAAAKATAAAPAAPANPMGGMLFPWERAVLDGERATKLTTLGKVYWLVFGVSLVVLVGGTVKDRYFKPPPPPVDPAIEIAKQERIKAGLRRAREGRSFTEVPVADDPFDGMTPAEIEKLVANDGETGGDPFEGMSPEEINAHLEKEKRLAALKRRGL